MTLSKAEMKTIEKELDLMEIKVMRLKAKLAPEEKITEEELRELKAAEKRIAKGKWIGLDELTNEFG